ncbi:glycoside hydrolase family 127 protein [Aporhodopirellula aestuarii]|uniref:Glycoside hydrolase family 127 protein n=1 Tax=Aporhodopirellula aestuarii TaxID=2950107 RepID=A0ABT0TZX1_9BACT|nr:glycoside hydrolase family 127 protein [Aporhodopirellula aestuarii]MCM2369924.1 glycoside hydrolase family 127 protein [Aporhodopirellula aestuarii]
MKFSIAIVFCLAIAEWASAQTHGIIDNSDSPYVQHRGINIGDCRWTDGFWGDKFRLCESVMVPHMGEILKGDIGHAYNNFRIAAGLKKGRHQGFAWHDGDFYKWIEAATYLYAINHDESTLTELDELIAIIAQAQEPDGYLHTKIQIENIPHFSNRRHHEMYNCGHLYTSACIHHRVTGKTNLLNIAIKNADLLVSLFQSRPTQLSRFGFNQTQIMGLVELYRTTGDKRYLNVAQVFINNRGKFRDKDDPSVTGESTGDMVQERVALRKETEAVGHAVLALYFYAGAADVYAETGEQALIDALDRLWENVVDKKMYVTGAVGQAHHGVSSRHDKISEGFLNEYVMPNLTAYNETCANICNAMFSYRMLGIKGESKYADVIERVLFNSCLSGISTDGTHYFYTNPLRKINGVLDYSTMNTEFAQRQPYLECFCCPPNLVRTIAKSSGWAYSLTNDGIAVNLYGANSLSTKLRDGSPIQLKQETQYPWDGHVKITIESCKNQPFEMKFRIPEWADGSKLTLNGNSADVDTAAGSFATIRGTWSPGDVIELELPMKIKLLEGNPRIEELRNQVAVSRGPVVYCIESPDIPPGTGILDVYLPSNAELIPRFNPHILGGVTTISGDIAIRSERSQRMYQAIDRPQWNTSRAQFIPYFAWNNRGDGEMTVFLPVIWK